MDAPLEILRRGYGGPSSAFRKSPCNGGSNRYPHHYTLHTKHGCPEICGLTYTTGADLGDSWDTASVIERGDPPGVQRGWENPLSIYYPMRKSSNKIWGSPLFDY